MLKNENDEQIIEEVERLEEKLSEEGFSEENKEKIIRYCERLVGLEQQLEGQELQAQVEIPLNN